MWVKLMRGLSEPELQDLSGIPARTKKKKNPAETEAHGGETLPSGSAGLGCRSRLSLGGRKLAATGTTYPVSGRSGMP
jgi:hypothetical protein